MAITALKDLQVFLADCGVTLAPDLVADNRLFQRTTSRLAAYAGNRIIWDSNADLIAALVGFASDPTILAGGVDAILRTSPEQFKRMIAGNSKAFIQWIRPGAKLTEKEHGIPAAITIAQGMLETGSGKRTIGYNLFGIKAGSSWTGKTQSVRTNEERNGVMREETALFKDFANFLDAIEDHAKVLLGAPYARARSEYAQTRNVIRFGHALTGVYATDSQYGAKLERIIRDYDLLLL